MGQDQTAASFLSNNSQLTTSERWICRPAIVAVVCEAIGSHPQSRVIPSPVTLVAASNGEQQTAVLTPDTTDNGQWRNKAKEGCDCSQRLDSRVGEDTKVIV